MKQAKEITKIDYNTNIFFGKELKRYGNGKVSIIVDYPKTTKENLNPVVTVKIVREQPPYEQERKLIPGDILFLDHKIDISAVTKITPNHIFPITLKMDGQEYKLNRTKQNKLILTK